jgi:hypothetical protein
MGHLVKLCDPLHSTLKYTYSLGRKAIYKIIVSFQIVPFHHLQCLCYPWNSFCLIFMGHVDPNGHADMDFWLALAWWYCMVTLYHSVFKNVSYLQEQKF